MLPGIHLWGKGKPTPKQRSLLSELKNEGIETELVHLAGTKIHGCTVRNELGTAPGDLDTGAFGIP
jgi:hypothetical protein